MKSTQPAISVAAIVTWLEEQERDLDLWKQQDNDVFYWRLIRFPLWMALHEKTGFMAEAHSPHSRKKNLMIGLKILKAFTLHNPWLVRKTINSVVFPHPRLIGGVEMHTQPVLEQLKAGEYIALYDSPYAKQLPGGKNLLASITWDALLRRVLRHKTTPLSPSSHALLTQVSANLRQRFGIEVDVCALAMQHVALFLKYRKIFERLFRQWKSQELYLVVNYTVQHLAAIDAAHRCGMCTTEIQHGSFSAFVPGYGFRDFAGDVPYYPQRFFALGQFWLDSTPLPRSTETQVIGATYMHERLAAFSPLEKTAKSVLFISQGTVGSTLCNIAIDVARTLKDHQVTYRLHPSESPAVYEQLFPLAIRPANFTFSQGQPDTHALLARAETIAGVHSTALYEGMLLGCRTILFDLPGIEHMEAVLERGDALLAVDAADFCAKLEQAPLCANPHDYYAPPQEILLD